MWVPSYVYRTQKSCGLLNRGIHTVDHMQRLRREIRHSVLGADLIYKISHATNMSVILEMALLEVELEMKHHSHRNSLPWCARRQTATI